MDKVVIYIIGIFFLIGGIDYLLGSPMKLGNKFEEGMKTMGALALGIIGLYSLSPALLSLLEPAAKVFSKVTHIDPSILPASIFAVDMGGYQLCTNITLNSKIGIFSAVVIASTLGTTISFTIPVACSLIQKEDQDFFAKGIMIGISTIPFGCLAGGIWMGINFLQLVWTLFPIFVLSIVLSIGLIKSPNGVINGFRYFGKFIMILSTLGIMLQGIHIIFGIKLVPTLVPFEDNMKLVGKITFILAGAYPMLEVLIRFLKNFFNRIARILGVDSISIVALVGNLASNLLVFGNLSRMNSKGKVICTSMGVSCAFVLGGQMAYVASVEPKMIGAYFITKIVSGILSLFLASRLFEYEYKKSTQLSEVSVMGGASYGD